jgi:hypothetical protein
MVAVYRLLEVEVNRSVETSGLLQAPWLSVVSGG